MTTGVEWRTGVREFSTEDFINYETRGTRSEFLKSEWKKVGHINVWLHRRRPFAGVWQHQVPRIDVRDDPQTGRTVRAVYSGNYRCLEDDAVLKSQYLRDRDTDERRNPPQICPICRMIEHVHMMVLREELHWLAPVFDFNAGSENDVLIRASGMWNGYRWDKMSDVSKQQAADVGITPRWSWKESIQPGLKYIFCLVDDDAVGKGVQIMKEGQAIGDKVKLAIAKEIKRNPRNPALGDPVQNPYAFQLSYKEDETPDKKYDAFRVDLDITPEIEDLISGEAPDISRLDGRYKPEVVRSMLEAVCQIDLPWDDFFSDEACALLAPPDEDEPKAETPAKSVERGAAVAARAPASRGVAASSRGAAAGRAPAPASRTVAAPARGTSRAALPPSRTTQARPAPVVDMVACDHCGKAMAATASKCPGCGAQYEVDAESAPPPQIRKRSEARASAAPPPVRGDAVGRAIDNRASRRVAPEQPAPRQQAAAPPPAAEAPLEDDLGFGEFGEDEIPFVHCRPDAFGATKRPRWERW